MTTGTVTNPTGSVNGKPLTGLQDAYTKLQGYTEPPAPGVEANWQMWSLLSDKTGVCARFTTSQSYLANEITLRIVTSSVGTTASGSKPWVPPAGDLPMTLQTGIDPATGLKYIHTSSDGVQRVLDVYFMAAGKNGGAGRDVAATSGTVTFTAMSDTDPDRGQSGSYDVVFGSDRVTGSFVGPWCG